jgi:predicted alpha/beta-hydrolase family hydrolase
VDELKIDTPRGPARVELRAVEAPRGALVLGHGAGGGIRAPDLQRAAQVAGAAGIAVALVEQPYLVAGRRSPAPAAHLDEAWLAVIATLRDGPFAAVPLLVGGRSSGARVACRTAAAAGAAGVLCLAFPVHAPGRGNDPSKSRLPELDAVEVPTLVVQGESDPFGMPPAGRNRVVTVVAGDHSLRKGLGALSGAVSDWLQRLLPRR